MKDVTPFVAINCITYNHQPYIRQCLEGFVMQKTNFPFVAIVHDDASTDGTAVVIKEYAEKYPDIIKPIYETENQYSKKDGSLDKIMVQAINNTGCKYIAFCEGDDYWIDPHKLQKQVDLMENDASCNVVYSRVVCYDQQVGKPVAVFGKQRKNLKERLLKECFIATCSCCVRKDDYENYLRDIEPSSHRWLMGDIPMFLYLGTRGNGRMLKECTSVYRILQTSASHSSDMDLQKMRIENTIEIYQYFANRYYRNDKKIAGSIDGSFLYRIYLLYKKNNQVIPDTYRSRILNYRGSNYKIYFVKYFLKYPSLEKIISKLIKLRMSIIILFSKK